MAIANGMAIFGIVLYVAIFVLIILAILALIKYLKEK